MAEEGRHASESPRKTPFVIGGVVVAAAVVALFFTLSGGAAGPLGLTDDPPEVPEFSFEVSKPVVITTAANPDPDSPPPTPAQIQAAEKKALAAAQPAADAAVEVLDDYYTAAFIDPANWQDAAYDEVFLGFTNKARAEAGSQLEIMTAGSEAGFDYETILPMPSVVRTKVLLDPDGSPASVIGIANFQASGDGNSGSHVFLSKGQFVLQKFDGEWQVVSYSVSRADKERGGRSDDGASATPDATGSPS